ncbi:plasmid recombination protein [Leuconostoc citreum]|uniref:MobV family relaxase n=1 Tax=Leuconostoc citreum TaxID=33964 RepID=UPI0021A91371|nr:MobV family relaxase [Leuconostoc citreum]MCT3054685.1 plasmid recombination protein [Leuconostoc citreum]MCT3061797.1 plasmid recombination protein [Leuconostoc citreum]
MSMVVARMQKMKAPNLIGLGNHTQRKTDNHSNKDIDVSRSYLNYDLVNRTDNYKTDIQQFINDNKSSSRAVRKDAVLINEWIITSDNHFFKDKDDKEIKDFFEQSKDYFAEKFGDENIRYAQVHLDETTPHMHLGIVPFNAENKLSAKTVFNRQALQAVQDELPTYLQERGFNLERGEKGSERKNLSVPEYKAMREDLKKIETEKQKTQAKLADTKKQLDKIKPRDNKKIASKPTLLNKNKITVDKSDLADLEQRAVTSDAYNFEKIHLEVENHSLRNDLIEAKGHNYELKKENERLQKLVGTLQGIIRNVDEFLHKKLGINLPDKWLERAGLKEPSKKAPESSQELDRHKSDELGGPHL